MSGDGLNASSLLEGKLQPGRVVEPPKRKLKRLGKHGAAHVIWDIELDGRTYEVELTHQPGFAGQRKLVVNQRVVLSRRVFRRKQTSKPRAERFAVRTRNNHTLVVQILPLPCGDRFDYTLRVCKENEMQLGKPSEAKGARVQMDHLAVSPSLAATHLIVGDDSDDDNADDEGVCATKAALAEDPESKSEGVDEEKGNNSAVSRHVAARLWHQQAVRLQKVLLNERAEAGKTRDQLAETSTALSQLEACLESAERTLLAAQTQLRNQQERQEQIQGQLDDAQVALSDAIEEAVQTQRELASAESKNAQLYARVQELENSRSTKRRKRVAVSRTSRDFLDTTGLP